MRQLPALLLAVAALAGGLPPSKAHTTWRSEKNRARLALTWAGLPADAPKKLPDGTTEPARAPWPFLLYIGTGESGGARKFEESVLGDTRFRLAARACKPVQVTPAEAIHLPYLRRVAGIKDPTVIVVRRDFTLVGVLRSRAEFSSNKVLALMEKAADGEYRIRLASYLKSYYRILEKAEKLWKEERAIEDLALRMRGRANKAAELEQREAALKQAEEALLGEEDALRATLVLKSDEPPLPTHTGKRELTPRERAALKTFRLYARDKNPLVRAAAVEDLGAVDTGFIAGVALKAADDVDPRVVAAAAAALGRMRSREALEAMAAALKSGKRRVRIAALLGLAAGAHDVPAAAADVAAVLAAGTPEERRAAIQAAAVQSDLAVVKPLIALLEDAEPGLRVMAASTLGERKQAEAVPALVARLTATDWSLRKAAAEALGRIRSKASIEPVLERFAVEEGLMRDVLHKTLVAITGQDFRYRVANWRRWWEQYGEGFTVPSDAEVAEAKRRAARALDGYATPGKRRYHKIETFSRKMIFVIDVSASMKDKIIIPADAQADAHERFPDRRKLEIAKAELIGLLATLDDRVLFNIITFAGRVKAWRPKLVSGMQKTAAIKYAAKLRPIQTSGRRSSGEEQLTNTWGALMRAFGVADEAVPDWRARTRVDTIFLVTDGTPTTGRVQEVPKLIRAITEMNRSRGTIIHVICFDKVTGRRLRPLAEQNGGELVVRGY
ncbi:MAG: HEAT repeat domain-containing protein [Planctomycetota bacterium]